MTNYLHGTPEIQVERLQDRLDEVEEDKATLLNTVLVMEETIENLEGINKELRERIEHLESVVDTYRREKFE